MAQSNDRNTKGGLFDDFSFSTVIASGLAAGTSFALSSQIGLAGSLIGVVIGGLASAAASQIYKSILKASAEKLSPNDGETGSAAIDGQAPHDDNDATRVVDSARITDRTRVVDSARIADKTRALSNSHDDVLKRGASVADATIPSQPRAASVSGSSHVKEYAETGTPIAPVAIRAAAHRRERDVIRRRATIFMAAASIIAVLVFALVVSIATKGEGIGSSTTIVVEAPQTTQAATGTATTHKHPATTEGAHASLQGGSNSNRDEGTSSSSPSTSGSSSNPSNGGSSDGSASDSSSSKPEGDTSNSGSASDSIHSNGSANGNGSSDTASGSGSSTK